MMQAQTISEMNSPPAADPARPSARPEATARQTQSAIRLMAAALGRPAEVPGKVVKLLGSLSRLVNQVEVQRRLDRLQARGYMETIPSRLQLAQGGADMLRYFIVPGARDYYETRGIDFNFHQVLRFLDDPSSVVDPVGVLSSRDTIICHVLQVVHANPLYDLQLLEMFEDGLDQMELQTQQMIDGTHPRAESIGAIVEDPDYHQRLLEYVRNYRRDPRTPELIREAGSARDDADFVLAELTFGSLRSFMRYANRLPNTLGGALRHLRNDKVIQPEHCDADVVAMHRAERHGRH